PNATTARGADVPRGSAFRQHRRLARYNDREVKRPVPMNVHVATMRGISNTGAPMHLWARIRSPNSLWRTLLYETLSGLTLNGRVLDVGGGTRKSSYLSLLRVEGQLDSLNI